MQDKLLYSDLTETILGCCFDVMNELGSGYLEAVYRNALVVALKEKGLEVEVEKRFQIIFRGQKIGLYIADLIVEGKVLVELKSCESLVGEHQAQLINYLKVSGMLVGLLVNFGKRKVKFKRQHHPDHPAYPITPNHLNYPDHLNHPHHPGHPAYPAACDPAYPVTPNHPNHLDHLDHLEPTVTHTYPRGEAQ